MSTPYEIDITMDAETVNALMSGGYQLYGFKGVQCTASGGQPLVWFASKTFSLNTAVTWAEQYEAYTSNSQIIPEGKITASAAYPIDLEQTLVVNSQAGTGVVNQGGVPLAITISNQSGGFQFTSGVSQMVGTTANPLCAFPLYGTATLQIAPIEQVMLMFATNTYNTGTVIENAFTIGILIDLTASSQRAVTFDINSGWSWDGGAWAQNVANNAKLAPLLIDTPSAHTRSLLSRHARSRRLALVA